ncbi:MAG: hypothetical protein MR016_09155 [Agathobacter sp.]|nr:hypothetical protein [Agathobacter sp.]
MEKENISTPYDEAVCTRELQMLKTIVPYIGNTQKKRVAALIQYLEYKNVMSALSESDNQLSACSIPEGSNRTSTLLGELKQYCTQSEKEAIDNLLNLLCIVDNYEMFHF